MKAVAALRNQFGGHAVHASIDTRGNNPVAEKPGLHVPELRCTSGTCSWAPSAAGSGWTWRLTPGPTVFVGRNGEGKTNLVEAVGYLATLGSHRVSTDAPLVRHGASAGRRPGGAAQGRPRAAGRDRDQPGPGQPGAGQPAPLPRPRELLGLVQDRAVRARGPRAGARRPGRAAPLPRRAAGQPHAAAGRRAQPTTTGCSSSATRCSRPRGWPAGDALATLDVWDGHLAELGGSCSGRPAAAGRRPRPARGRSPTPRWPGRARRRRHWATPAPCRWPATAPRSLRAASLPTAERARRRAARAARRAAPGRGRPRRDAGRSAPRRPGLHLGPAPAKGYASHGESWSLALALEAGHLRAVAGRRGGAGAGPGRRLRHLDADRRAALAAVARSAEQTLITAAVLEDVPAELRRHVVVVGDGAAVPLPVGGSGDAGPVPDSLLEVDGG